MSDHQQIEQNKLRKTAQRTAATTQFENVSGRQNHILGLQGVIGNRAVQRLIQPTPKPSVTPNISRYTIQRDDGVEEGLSKGTNMMGMYGDSTRGAMKAFGGSVPRFAKGVPFLGNLLGIGQTGYHLYQGNYNKALGSGIDAMMPPGLNFVNSMLGMGGMSVGDNVSKYMDDRD